MPYIKQDRRKKLDSAIDRLATKLHNLCDISVDSPGNFINPGDLNYVITSLCNRAGASNYAGYNELIGVLECCKLELYRRAISRYEDKKADENGDVYFL